MIQPSVLSRNLSENRVRFSDRAPANGIGSKELPVCAYAVIENNCDGGTIRRIAEMGKRAAAYTARRHASWTAHADFIAKRQV